MGVPLGPPPCCRNLTSTYLRYRNNHRASAGKGALGGPPDGIQGQQLIDPEDPRGIELSVLPPQWVDSAQEARDVIKQIKERLAQLAKAQHRRLLKVFDDAGDGDKEVMGLFQQISQLIKKCEQCIHQVKTLGGASCSHSDKEFRLNVQRGLATTLQELSQEFRTSQKEYLSKIKQRQGGDLWDAPTGDSSGSTARPEVGFSDGQLLELESMETNASQRSGEITQIAASISDLHTVFKELAVLVIDQGSILDRIDYNIEQVVHTSQDANVQLQKAEKSSKSNRAMKCIFVLVAINVVLLLILILKARH
eukprot:TRINITY_DN19109_c0_g1_i1.p1 TRINITY_DN19109_c0_g1~~TRINITY_DN19109_c0_g1_i1.p1  ORF type:complete len:308 (+),score=66.75 TRINITY_DN19109_c0_g1_i1:162-1085(+)